MTILELHCCDPSTVLLMTQLARCLQLSERLMLLGGGVLIGLILHFDGVNPPRTPSR
ncbi:hypothetical protein [Streptomyces sp. NPDC001675]